ncbi:hypothetical protein ACQ4PT_060818 [Festuca glaucescens]
MQGVVAALAAAAQKGGVEGVPNPVEANRVPAVAQTAGQPVALVVQLLQAVAPGTQQVQPMQLDTAALPKPDAPNPAKKAKKAKKNPCFRCKQPGHQIDTCTAPVCDIWGTYKPKVDNVKLVKVTVEGDPMSIPEIAECLRRIVPVENFQWEIYNFQNNVFRVKFPNKLEAQRMKTFRTYPVPDRASDLIFEDWSALEDPLYMLPEVWLRVRGIPADVRTDFLSLWAVGTLLGKTKEVDMVHTRKNKELRLRIGCLEHTLIPETTDVFIQRGFFKLTFDVEPVIVTQLGDDGIDGNGGNNGGGDDNGANGDNRDGANDMDIEKAVNNECQDNGNNQNGNVKQVNNGKGVVGHQVQHQFEPPIVFGSLNSDLLSKERDNAGAPFQVDSLPGSVKIRPVSATGLVRSASAGCSPLPLGSQRPAGMTAVAAEPSPGAASTPARSPRSPLSQRSPLSPCRPQLVSALSAPAHCAASPLGGMAPVVGPVVASASPSGTPRECTPVPPSPSPVALTVAGPGGQSKTEAQDRAPAAVFSDRLRPASL